MKHTLSLILMATTVSAIANPLPVSVYDFNGSLAPIVNRFGTAQDLEFRAGRTGSVIVPATYSTETVGSVTKQVANFDDVANQEKFFRARHGMAVNGGGAYVNQYSMLFDLKVTSVGDWVSLYNTNHDNQNDGDAFIRASDSGLGISGVYAGTFERNQWNRVVITVDQGANQMNFYLNGGLVHQVALSGGTDGRWALYAYDDAFASWTDILGDNDGDNGIGQISLLGFYDTVLSANDVAALGPVGNPVPEPATLAVLGVGAIAAIRRWRK